MLRKPGPARVPNGQNDHNRGKKDRRRLSKPAEIPVVGKLVTKGKKKSEEPQKRLVVKRDTRYHKPLTLVPPSVA